MLSVHRQMPGTEHDGTCHMPKHELWAAAQSESICLACRKPRGNPLNVHLKGPRLEGEVKDPLPYGPK